MTETFVTCLQLRADLARVRRAAVAPEGWLPAWRHVRALELVADGDGSGRGRRYRTTVRAAAPYSLTWEMEVVRCEPDVVAWTATGDLVGTGRWELTERDGVTQIRSTWTVRPTPRWIVLLWPLARWWFVRNHDLLMRRGARHLATHLDVELIGDVVPQLGPGVVPVGARP